MLALFVTEMEYSMYQSNDYVSASIKANPNIKYYSAMFTDIGFTVSGDG